MRVVVGVVLLLLPRAAFAWDTATPVWCGTTVAAATQTEVVVVAAGTHKTIPVGSGAPMLLGFSADCSMLAVVSDRVAVIDVASSALTDLGPIPTPLTVNPRIPVSWAPMSRTFGVLFYSGNRRGNDTVRVFDPTARTAAVLAVPPGEVDGFELEAAGRATIAMKVGGIFGPDSVVTASTAGWRALSATTYERLFIAGHAAVGSTAGGAVMAIDLATSAERVVASHAKWLDGISSDGSHAIVTFDGPLNAVRLASIPLRRGASVAFSLSAYDAVWNVDGTILMGSSGTRSGPAATHNILFADAGHGAPSIAYDAGPYGSAKAVAHAAVSADGSHVAFIATSRSANHTTAVCGDWSWDEHHELVIAPSPLVTVALANTVGCAYE